MANPDFALSSPTRPPGFSRGGRDCAGSNCGSSADYSSDEEYFSTASSGMPTQKEVSRGMQDKRKRSRSAEKEDEEREAKKKRLFDQKQQQQEEEEEDDMSNDQKSLSLSSMGVGCCESLRHHISSGCAVPPCYVIVPHFLRRLAYSIRIVC